jgi:hypothetical protein
MARRPARGFGRRDISPHQARAAASKEAKIGGWNEPVRRLLRVGSRQRRARPNPATDAVRGRRSAAANPHAKPRRAHGEIRPMHAPHGMRRRGAPSLEWAAGVTGDGSAAPAARRHVNRAAGSPAATVAGSPPVTMRWQSVKGVAVAVRTGLRNAAPEGRGCGVIAGFSGPAEAGFSCRFLRAAPAGGRRVRRRRRSTRERRVVCVLPQAAAVAAPGLRPRRRRSHGNPRRLLANSTIEAGSGTVGPGG